MSEPSGLLALGQALDAYLVGEFSPPPGTRTELGFLAGVPVDHDTFLNAGAVNPMLVNAFLNLVADKVAPVVDGRFAGSLLPASQLFASILMMATPVAAPGTPEANAFAALKSAAGSAFGLLGMPHDVVTAPTGWHDPADRDGWSTFSTTTSQAGGTTTTTSTGDVPPKDTSGQTPPIVVHPRFERLWRFRTLDPATMAQAIAPADEPVEPEAGPVRKPVVRGALAIDPDLAEALRGRKAPRAQLGRIAALRGVHGGLGATLRLAPALRAVTDDAPAPAGRGRVLASAPRAQFTNLVDATPLLVARDEPVAKAQAMARLLADKAPELVADVADDTQTSTSQSVESQELTLSLEYAFVQLSRDAWWNDVLVRMPGWYVPGLPAGSLVPGPGLAGSSVGVPIAMVVTRNVRVSGTWSEADRAAVTAHTSLGPWTLRQSDMTFEQSATTATLTMPGTQVVALVCALLPALPPAEAPTVAPAVATG